MCSHILVPGVLYRLDSIEELILDFNYFNSTMILWFIFGSPLTIYAITSSFSINQHPWIETRVGTAYCNPSIIFLHQALLFSPFINPSQIYREKYRKVIINVFSLHLSLARD